MYFTRGVGEMQKVRPDGQQESLYRPFFSDVFTSFDPDVFLLYLDTLGYRTRVGAQIDALALQLEGVPVNCVRLWPVLAFKVMVAFWLFLILPICLVILLNKVPPPLLKLWFKMTNPVNLILVFPLLFRSFV